MADPNVAPRSVARKLATILDSPEISQLVADLEAAQLTGRPPGYSKKSLIGLALAKALYQRPTWTGIVALANEHDALRRAIGGSVPSIHACYRFTKKLLGHQPLLEACADRVLASLKAQNPDMGAHIAIDGSALHAYANGHKTRSRGGRVREMKEFSDPDASWGHQSATSTEGQGRSIYGYKLHLAVDTATDSPVAWHFDTAAAAESNFATGLLDKARERGFPAFACTMDKGYDAERIYEAFEERGCRPIIPLRATKAVKQGRHLPHRCRHGEWVFAGTDNRRKAAKFRCPQRKCPVSSRWVPASRLHTLIPRTTRRWKRLRNERSAVERANSRLKNDFALQPLRVRGLDRVRLHGDLAIIALLASALARARAGP